MDALALSTEQAMLAVGGTDTPSLKKAEVYLKTFLTKKAAAPTLLSLCTQSAHTVVRQLAAVLVRRKMRPLWNRLEPAARDSLKSGLIQRLAAEPARGVRKAVSSLIVTLGKALLPAGQWPELAAAIQAAATHASEELREISMVLLHDLVPAIGSIDCLAAWLRPVISAALNDVGSKKVRHAALEALAVALRFVNARKYSALFRDALPELMAAVRACLGEGEEDAVASALETVTDLIDENSPLFTPHVESVANMLILVVAQDTFEGETRDAASQALIRIIEAKPKTFLKKGLVDVVRPASGGAGMGGPGETSQPILHRAHPHVRTLPVILACARAAHHFRPRPHVHPHSTRCCRRCPL